MAKGFNRPKNAYHLVKDETDQRWYPFEPWTIVVSKGEAIPTQGIVFETSKGQVLWFVCPKGSGRIHRQHFLLGVSREDYQVATPEEQAEILSGFKAHINQSDHAPGWPNVVAFVSVLR